MMPYHAFGTNNFFIETISTIPRLLLYVILPILLQKLMNSYDSYSGSIICFKKHMVLSHAVGVNNVSLQQITVIPKQLCMASFLFHGET